MNLDKYPDIITAEEVAEILRISKPIAYKLIQSNDIQSKKIGNIYRIRKESLISYLNS